MKNIKAIDYIKIAAANAYGLDKLTWDERIAWFDDPYEVGDGAKEPLMYQKALDAFEDAIQGVPSNFCVGLDCTASGLELMSILSGDVTGGKNVNLIDTGNREDIYEKISNYMNQLGCKTDRKLLKKPIMCFFYGSTKRAKEIFNTQQLFYFLEALKTFLPGAYEVMADIQSLISPYRDNYEWVLPDGYTATCDVHMTVTETMSLFGEDVEYRYKIKSEKRGDKSLAANVIHSIDAYVLRQLILKCDFDMYTIHDCYFCHPNNMQKLRENLLEIFIEISEQDLLGNIIGQLVNDDSVKYEKINSNFTELLRTGEYFIS